MSKLYNLASSGIRLIYDKRIDSPAILDAASYFPNAVKFCLAWEIIRNEALAARLSSAPRFHELMPEQSDLSANDGLDWRMFILKAYGVGVPENLARMPGLNALLGQCPEVKSAAISYLAPRKHIPRHRGPFRGIMRFHLGLDVPLQIDGTPATVMVINDEERRIGDGEGMLWDDTFPHEVTNHSDSPRVALLLDVWRPRMPFDVNILSHAILRAVQLGMSYRGVKFTG